MSVDLPTGNLKATLINGAAVLGGIAILALMWTWSAVVSMGMESDLEEYHRLVRNSEIPLDEKIVLLDQIDFFRDNLHAIPVGYFRWAKFNRTVREMLKGRLTREKAVFIEREFSRLRRELGETKHSRETTQPWPNL